MKKGPGGPLPIRIYRPQGAALRASLLYLHGGGWTFGGLDSHDDICAELAEGAEVGVVAVEYRLAPEHRFPAAFEDCRAARDWIAGQIGRNNNVAFDFSQHVEGGDGREGDKRCGTDGRP